MKYYAKVNRSGTQVRIKESHKLLTAYINNRESFPFINGDSPAEVVLVSKSDWFRICNELKIGMQDNYIEITDFRKTSGIIIANEEMKSEVMKMIKILELKKDYEHSINQAGKEKEAEAQEDIQNQPGGEVLRKKKIRS